MFAGLSERAERNVHMVDVNRCLRRAFVLLLVITSFHAWCADAQLLELEIMKKNAERKSKWKSEGTVQKGDIPGFYRHFPGDWNAFWLKPDGTGLLYGGMRGAGIWNIMWEYHPDKDHTLCLRSVQLKREYKVIMKDGKVWMVEGREVWRQHVHFNHPIKQPRDCAVKIAEKPPETLRSVWGRVPGSAKAGKRKD
jgi:hypothetical protein